MADIAKLNRANFWLVPFAGYPLRLWQGGAAIGEGVVTNRTAAVTARVYAETRADVHLALYQAPLLRNGADSRLLAQTDYADLGGQIQEISVAPASPDSSPVAQAGSIAMTANSAAVAGTGTAFATDGSWAGLELQIAGGLWYPIASVASATALTLDMAAQVTATGAYRLRVPPPRAYIFRIWVDNITDASRDAATRQASAAISTAGTVSTVAGSNIVTGSGTSFSWSWAGYTLTVGSQTFMIAEVISATRLRTVNYATATASGSAYAVSSPAVLETTQLGGVIVESIKVS